jgi:hypothetical protein
MGLSVSPLVWMTIVPRPWTACRLPEERHHWIRNLSVFWARCDAGDDGAVQAAPELTQNPTESPESKSSMTCPSWLALAVLDRDRKTASSVKTTFPDHVGGASAPVGAAGASLCSEITLKADAELPAFMYSLTSLKN